MAAMEGFGNYETSVEGIYETVFNSGSDLVFGSFVEVDILNIGAIIGEIELTE